MTVFDIGRHIKEKYEHIPIVILTPFSHGITKRIINEDLSAFEYVFCWLGNTDLLVSIIKLMEDKMNLEHDVQEVGVQLILLVEDGIRFYSSILPNLYKFVLKQSQEFSTEALNAHQRTPVCVDVLKSFWHARIKRQWRSIVNIRTIY